MTTTSMTDSETRKAMIEEGRKRMDEFRKKTIYATSPSLDSYLNNSKSNDDIPPRTPTRELHGYLEPSTTPRRGLESNGTVAYTPVAKNFKYQLDKIKRDELDLAAAEWNEQNILFNELREEYEERENELRSNIDELAATIQTKNQTISDLTKTNEQTAEQAKRLEKTISDNELQLKSLTNNCEKLQNQVESLQKELDKKESDALDKSSKFRTEMSSTIEKHTAEISRKDSKIRELIEDCESLQSKVESLTKQLHSYEEESLQRLQSQDTKYSDEVENFRQQIASHKEREVALLEEKRSLKLIVDQLREEDTTHKARVQAFRDEIGEIRSEMESKVERYRGEIVDLKKKLETKNHETESTMVQLLEERKEHTQAKQRFNEIQSLLEESRVTIDELERNLSTKDDQVHKFQSLQDQVATQAHQIQEMRVLKDKLAEKEAESRELRRLQDTLEMKDQQIKALASLEDLMVLKDKQIQELLDAEDAATETRHENEQLRTEMCRLRESISQLKSATEERVEAEVMSVRDDLHAKLRASELEAQKSLETAQELHTANSTLRQQLEQKSHQIHNLERARDDMRRKETSTEKTYGVLKRDFEKLKHSYEEKFEKARDKLEDTQKTLAEERELRKELEQTLENTTSQFAELEQKYVAEITNLSEKFELELERAREESMRQPEDANSPSKDSRQPEHELGGNSYSLGIRVEALEETIRHISKSLSIDTDQQQTIHQLTLDIESGQKKMIAMRKQIRELLASRQKHHASEDILDRNYEEDDERHSYQKLFQKYKDMVVSNKEHELKLQRATKACEVAESKVQFLQSEFTNLFFDLFEQEKKRKLASIRMKKVLAASNDIGRYDSN